MLPKVDPFTLIWSYAALQFAMIAFALIRGGIVLGRMPSSRGDVVAIQKKATSPWDPIGEEGIKQMRRISWALFAFLVIALLVLPH
jgi:hypothetical protein